jgi:recombination protein RecR
MNSIERLIAELEKLPGIGRKTAQRIAFWIILKLDKEGAVSLAKAITAVKEIVRPCSICFNTTETDTCHICADPRRNREVICVVEGPSDVLALERTRLYRGTYHVLGGALSPLNGIGPDDLRIKELLSRVGTGSVKEVILACNPSIEGQATTLHLYRLLTPLSPKVTALALGLPMGGDLELADEVTLSRAFEGRREIG